MIVDEKLPERIDVKVRCPCVHVCAYVHVCVIHVCTRAHLSSSCPDVEASLGLRRLGLSHLVLLHQVAGELLHLVMSEDGSGVEVGGELGALYKQVQDRYEEGCKWLKGIVDLGKEVSGHIGHVGHIGYIPLISARR